MPRYKGWPGEPGEAGRPGEPDRGGDGGKGGHGGKGGDTRHLFGIVTFVTILALGLSSGTLVLAANVNYNTHQIARIQRVNEQEERQANADLAHTNRMQDEALVAARRAEYRICVRQMTTRVVLLLRGDWPRAHLYSCAPNLTGGWARPMTRRQRAAFIALVRSGKAP